MTSRISLRHVVAGVEEIMRSAPASRQLASTCTDPKVAISRRPSEVLVENSNIRPDVAKVAILGYN